MENTKIYEKHPEVLSLRDMTYQHVMYALMICNGNRTNTCKALSISIRTLRNWINEWETSKGIIVPTGEDENFLNKFLHVNGFKQSEEFHAEVYENVMKPITRALISEFGFPPEELSNGIDRVSEEDVSMHPCAETSSPTDSSISQN